MQEDVLEKVITTVRQQDTKNKITYLIHSVVPVAFNLSRQYADRIDKQTQYDTLYQRQVKYVRQNQDDSAVILILFGGTRENCSCRSILIAILTYS
jgi:hypothetical protein